LIRTDLERLRAALEPMSEDLDRIRTTFAATSEELEKLREAVTPELIGVREATDQVNTGVRDQVQSVRELDGIVQTMGERLEARLTALHDLFVPLIKDAGEVREVVEPLQGATERMGRIADRLPGPGRKQ
jgi:chromosome segregation ATPase